MMRLTQTVKHLIIINVIIFFGYSMLEQQFNLPNLAVFYPSSENFKPFQLVTHMFMHGNTSHLLIC